jgi:predicted RNA polymerase sigma factor
VTAAALDFAGENLLRDLAPQVLGAVIRRFGDFAAAEDAVQEALLAAALQWPAEGVPENPRGWLIHVAARRMTDHLRTELARRRREAIVVAPGPAGEPFEIPALEDGGYGAADRDDKLILLFMSCHPALTRPSAIALTLRAVGRPTPPENGKPVQPPEACTAPRLSPGKTGDRE